MKTSFFLVVNKKGSVRSCKTKPDLAWDEVSLKLNLALPDVLFEKPQLSATISVADGQCQPVDISPEVAGNIKEAIESAAGMVVKLQVVNQ